MSSIDKIRETLTHLLSNERVFKYSTRKTFDQFDVDKDRLLNFEETKNVFRTICTNLTIPPINDSRLRVIFEKYDSKDQNGLSVDDFAMMYKAVLRRIRLKYYPPRIDEIRSTLWVPMSPVARTVDVYENLKRDEALGSGAYGTVYKVFDTRVNAMRACKVINKARLNLPIEQVEEEVTIMKSVDHPNVIRIYEIFEDPNSIYIVQELCTGGPLLTTLLIDEGKAAKLNESTVREIMKQLFEGLAHIHAKRIVHKDLKPDNILFANKQDNTVKIIDFGLGEIFRGEAAAVTDVLRGSAVYMAPEAFREGVICLKSDVWACGCIMFNLLTGEFAFDARDIKALKQVILHHELDLDRLLPRSISRQAKDLLGQLFQKYPAKRPSSKAVLSHPWFDDGCQMSADSLLSNSMCLNMKLYAKQNGLRNLFVNMMARQLCVTNSHVDKITKLFKQIDTERTGVIKPSDLQKVLKKAGFPEWDINLIIQHLDIKGENMISYTEFLAACYSWRESELNLVWATFKRFAKGDSQEVTTAQLKQILSKHAPQQNEQQVNASALFMFDQDSILDQMIAELDSDNDGIVTWTEFEAFIRGRV